MRWLSTRSTLSTRMTNAPFYAVYNVGSYTFAPYKVIWAEQSGTFEAAVAAAGEVPLLGQRPYVPDHKIFLLSSKKPSPPISCAGCSFPLSSRNSSRVTIFRFKLETSLST